MIMFFIKFIFCFFDGKAKDWMQQKYGLMITYNAIHVTSLDIVILFS